jgi:hypothetical protein
MYAGVGRWRRIVASCLLAPLFLGACAGGPGSPSTLNAGSEQIVLAAQNGVRIYYEESILPAGYVAGALSDQEHTGLRNRITRDLQQYMTGAELQSRLDDTLNWADMIAHDPSVRTLTVRMLAFDGEIVTRDDRQATVAGTYTVYQVNARGDGSDLTTWGGTLVMSYAADVDSVGGTWLVSSLSLQQSSFTPDPSALTQPSLSPGSPTAPTISASGS